MTDSILIREGVSIYLTRQLAAGNQVHAEIGAARAAKTGPLIRVFGNT